jgi:hypothetical protein
MRRLKNPRTDRENGAAAVLVAVMMLVLIGAGALAVDVGQIYAERAQLQNAADAGAIAIAQACHETGCSQAQAEAIAQPLANGNSNDGQSNVSDVDLSVANQVTVRTTTQNGSNSFLNKLFASALNAPPASVGAFAIASAEPPSSGSSFPLALSDCQYDLSGAVAEGQVQLIRYKPGMSKCTSTSGHVIPGGFGWLSQTSTCEATTDADDIVSTDTGADYAAECDAVLQGWISDINGGDQALATFPVYDNAGGTGKGGWFHIRGYATFDIQGWKFGGGDKAPRTFHNKAPFVSDPADACTGACLGIIGQFIKYESIESFAGGSGGGVDLGTVNIRLIH